MTVDINELPLNWTLPRISDVTDIVPNADPVKSPAKYFNYVDISSIDNLHQKMTQPKRLLGKKAPSRAKRPIRDGDILFSNVRTYLKNIAMVEEVAQPAIASTGFTVLRPTEKVDRHYLFRFVTSNDFIQALTAMQTGTHYPATSDRVVRSQPIPLPPLPEQRRIAERLDDIDDCQLKATAQLLKVTSLMSRLRRSILIAAGSGLLTEDWREQNARDDWMIMLASEVCLKVQSGGTPRTGFTDHPGVPFLKVYNVVDQEVDFAYRPQYVPEEIHNGVLRKSVAYPGDVIMNIVGPPLGKVAIVPNDYPEWNLNQALTIFRPGPRVLGEWLYLYLCSGLFMNDDGLVTRGSAGQSNISLTQCRNLRIPVPNLDEQREIVRIVAEQLRLCDLLEAWSEKVRKLLEGAGQAAASKAFRGRLFDED